MPQNSGMICASHRHEMNSHCVEMSNTVTHAEVRNLTDHMGPLQCQCRQSERDRQPFVSTGPLRRINLICNTAAAKRSQQVHAQSTSTTSSLVS